MNGSVPVSDAAPSARWKQVIAQKAGKLSALPDASDAAVYLDEMVHFLVAKYGRAAKGGVQA